MFYSLLITATLFTVPADSLHPGKTEPPVTFNNRITEAKNFCRKHGYDTGVCFLLDLSIHNGLKRFFICDMSTGKIIGSGLVTHGSCNTHYLSHVLYSDEPGCGCSSSGKYRVGNFYKGTFGDAYKLVGLDNSNRHAYERSIVLHSHSCVPDEEIYPNQICNSQGCTTVSPAFLRTLEMIIVKKKKPILLWVLG